MLFRSWVKAAGPEAVQLWEAASEKIGKKLMGRFPTSAIKGTTLAETVGMLNKAYLEKAMLIEPCLTAAIEKFVKEESNYDYRRAFLASLMSDIEKANIVIASHEFMPSGSMLGELEQYNTGSYSMNIQENVDRALRRSSTSRQILGDMTSDSLALGGVNRPWSNSNALTSRPLLQLSMLNPHVASVDQMSSTAVSTLSINRSSPVKGTLFYGLTNPEVEGLATISDALRNDMVKNNQREANVINYLQHSIDREKNEIDNQIGALEDIVKGEIGRAHV